MPRCEMELCPNWSGDGRVCDCARYDGASDRSLYEGRWPAPERCTEFFPEGWAASAHPPQCVLASRHDGLHRDAGGRQWDNYGQVRGKV
jgi:hypothetical protein